MENPTTNENIHKLPLSLAVTRHSLPSTAQISTSRTAVSLTPTFHPKDNTMSTALRKATLLGVVALKLASAKDTPSPNKPIPKPECDDNINVSIRYNSASARLYVESADGNTRGGCVTLQQIWEKQGGEVPLYAINPKTGDVSNTATGTWLLTKEMYVEDGITLKVCLNNSCD